ncbi:hypothetical protein FGIG_09232 [Fasciola gigantica]|uniref:RRM domain-containing protein n=1 Tax=Fasciola gigantica TaxID=46835 RepID=A0A504YNC6_FASGI|nr:hypothetical protein FGIG_09232 [Fasciola gigantica]
MKTRKDTVAKAPKPDRRKKRFSDGAQKPSSKSKKTKDKEGGVKSPETSEVRKITRKKHSNVTTGPRPISYSKLATASLILKHLPPTIDYSQLKAIVPTASRLELYKKNGKRHAFARFSSTEECSTVASKLRNLKISGQEVAVAFASHSRFKQSHAATSSEADDSTTLHLSNLPFNITQEKLEEEFPTASQIVMNRNSHGRFRGSCLLQFDSPDDCCTVRDACRGRQIEGRPLRCSLAIKMDVKHTNTKSEAASAKLFGLKVKGVPTHIDESELRALFNQHKLIEFRCAKDSNEGTKTILLKFKSRHDQRAALNAFHQKAFFGVPLSAKIWCEFHFNANEFYTLRTVVCQETVYRSLLHFVHPFNLIKQTDPT